MKKRMFCMLGVLAVVLAGCGQEAQVEQTQPICVGAVSTEYLFSTTLGVLKGMQFQIDKADLEARQIITRPLRGGQFFEVWRQDNASGAAGAESNLHSTQRIAEVRFDQSGDLACANCRVIVRRLSMPESSVTGNSGRDMM